MCYVLCLLQKFALLLNALPYSYFSVRAIYINLHPIEPWLTYRLPITEWSMVLAILADLIISNIKDRVAGYFYHLQLRALSSKLSSVANLIILNFVSL